MRLLATLRNHWIGHDLGKIMTPRPARNLPVVIAAMLRGRPASCYVELGDAVTAAHSPLAGMGVRLGFRRIFLALAAIGYCVTAQAAPEPVEIPADGFTLHATLF